MKSLSYEERLRTLDLYSLEFRRMRGDLIETYRILRGLDRMDVERMFPLVGKTRTRGHNLRLKGRSCKTEMRRNFFSQRVVNLWNSLPQKAVEGRSLTVFKTAIDRFLINQGLWGKGRRMGMRKISAMIEWRSRLDGPSGLILLLWSYGLVTGLTG